MAISKHTVYEMMNDFADLNKTEIRESIRLLTLSRYDIGRGINAKFLNEAYRTFNIDKNIDYKGIYINDSQLFNAFGIDSIDTMDYSAYQGAKIIHDLNNSDVELSLHNKYDYIVDSGTLEHVFHLPNALTGIYKMLKIGGTFIFEQPVFFGINHGFYNISPCFFYEYFLVNKYKINRFNLYASEKLEDGELRYTKMEVDEKTLRSGDILLQNASQYILINGSVTKTSETVCTAIPNQYVYQEHWQTGSHLNDTIAKLINDAEGRVYLYGTGYYTKRLINNFNANQINKLEQQGGLISPYAEEIGHIFTYNIKIYDISSIKSGDIVIISSEKFANIIYNRISYLENQGVHIIKLH